MAEAATLTATARVPLADPAAMLHRLCDHFAEHGEVTIGEGTGRLEGRFGAVELCVEEMVLWVRVECPAPDYLFAVKASVAEHIVEFAEGEPPELVWSGDGANVTEIPYFHELTVRGSRAIAPRMRRVTLAGDVSRLDHDGLHVRVLIPPRGREPVWPSLSSDGRIIWPKGEDALAPRVYTIRSIDHGRGEIDIDVVLHEDSPGSVWARTAQAGDPIGLMGPGGGDIEPADWYLLAGDETALPVIARIAESLPATARATIRIEVADASEQQPIVSAAAIDIAWLHRDGAAPGTTDLLEQAVRAIDWPDAALPYVLVGCEHKAARAIRGYLRKERGLARDRHLAAAYWRRGHAEAAPDDAE